MAQIYDFVSEDTGLINGHVNTFLPRTVFIALSDSGGNSSILVKEGSEVGEGQIISHSKNSVIHSSIPGIVENIEEHEFSDGARLSAKIKLGGKFSYTGRTLTNRNWKSMDSEQILRKIHDKGIINSFFLGKKTEKNSELSLSEEIKNSPKEKNRILAVRFFDDDPSRLTDSFIAGHFFEKVKTGAMIAAKAYNASAVVFAFDKNKSGTAPFLNEENDKNEKQEMVSETGEFEIPVLKVFIDAMSYPCGTTHDIVNAVKKAADEEPFSFIGSKDLFIDSSTALDTYNGVVLGIPVVNRFVHITGDCLNTAAIVNVKIGSTVRDIVEQCGGFKRKPGQIFINGKVLGIPLDSMDIPVTKSMKSILFIPKKQIPDQHQEKCVRCGNCRNVCPVGIFPESLYRLSLALKIENEDDELIRNTAEICTECGLCNSVCPSRIPLCQIISAIKDNVTEVSKDEQ